MIPISAFTWPVVRTVLVWTLVLGLVSLDAYLLIARP